MERIVRVNSTAEKLAHQDSLIQQLTAERDIANRLLEEIRNERTLNRDLLIWIALVAIVFFAYFWLRTVTR